MGPVERWLGVFPIVKEMSFVYILTVCSFLAIWLLLRGDDIGGLWFWCKFWLLNTCFGGGVALIAGQFFRSVFS